MKQLTQNLKDGAMQILEVPAPGINKGNIFVRNMYSVISAGTEGKTVSDARKGYIAKAQSRQKEVKQVIDLAKKQGLVDTYKMVMNKLEAPSPLGYSCAGQVIAVAPDVTDFQIGDLVACAGSAAVHAEVVAVPRNLCVEVPANVDIKHAAFSTIAAIALQGIRQADLRLGENCAIIGLGLIGQLTVQMLKAAGVHTIGIDIEPAQVALAQETGCNLPLERNRDDLENRIMEFTSGFGVDAVIITAGTSSLDPVELAGRLCRKKGKVVIVGAVPTGFSREHYYKKELDLRMSSSYGPGRYDPVYEEKGIDYPIGYVRWTENRNMQAYLQLLAAKKINIDKLITHEFDFAKAPEAYQMILEKKEPFVGIVLKYDIDQPIRPEIRLRETRVKVDEVNIGFIGAGSFAQNMLLPNVYQLANMIGVASAKGNEARNVADKYGFDFATGDAEEIISNKDINTIFIVTPHNLHAEYVLKGLKAGKNVFVEKPLALKLEELGEIEKYYQSLPASERPGLMVGFNRRFSPHILKIKNLFSDQIPKAINYRINAGHVPPEHWVQDPDIGGGRIIGEVCHFFDLCMFIAASEPVTVSANVLQSAQSLMDTLTVNISFKNGSIASIAYFSNGSKELPKEYLEVFSANQVAIVYDFKSMEVYGKKMTKTKLPRQDKGHKQELIEFVNALKEGKTLPISFGDLYISSLAPFKIIESIQTRKTITF